MIYYYFRKFIARDERGERHPHTGHASVHVCVCVWHIEDAYGCVPSLPLAREKLCPLCPIVSTWVTVCCVHHSSICSDVISITLSHTILLSIIVTFFTYVDCNKWRWEVGDIAQSWFACSERERMIVMLMMMEISWVEGDRVSVIIGLCADFIPKIEGIVLHWAHGPGRD